MKCYEMRLTHALFILSYVIHCSSAQVHSLSYTESYGISSSTFRTCRLLATYLNCDFLCFFFMLEYYFFFFQTLLYSKIFFTFLLHLKLFIFFYPHFFKHPFLKESDLHLMLSYFYLLFSLVHEISILAPFTYKTFQTFGKL